MLIFFSESHLNVNVVYQIAALKVKNCGVGVNFNWPYTIALSSLLLHMFRWHFWLARRVQWDSWVGQGVIGVIGKVGQVFQLGQMVQVDQVVQIGRVSQFSQQGGVGHLDQLGM